MAAVTVPTGTLGDLTPHQEQKLQETWIHLLRLSGVETANSADAPSATAGDSNTYSQLLKEPSPAAFRRKLWSFIIAEHPDALVLRFLRARKWDINRAMAMLISAINWRDEKHIEETVLRVGEDVAFKEDPSADEKGFLAQYRSGKSYIRATDREHRAVYIVKIALHHPNLQSSQAMESYILHNIEIIRILLQAPNDKCCLLFDMTGFGIRNMDFHIAKFLITVFEARYPETLGLVLIHNAPFVFSGVWNILRRWLDPVVASKVNFTRNTADLRRFIPEENLQAGYGGTDSWEYTYTDPVPGENARLGEQDGMAKIQEERNELIREFEQQTSEWASLDSESPTAKEKSLRRDELAGRLGVNYWKLDPYIRSRTYYHRVGVVDEDGKVDFKAAQHEKRAAS